MNIVVLRSYGDYVILLNSLKNTTIKHSIHLIVSSHLKLLHDALKLNLSLEGYEVTSAFDGPEALKQIENAAFDLIILDVIH